MDSGKHKIGWVPLFGEFEIDSNTIRFKGRRIALPIPGEPPGAELKEQPMLGLLLSSHTLADGELAADIEFERVIPETLCELTVAYNPNAAHLVSAGVGGEPFALFTIREFGGSKTPQGWWDYRAAGDRSILTPGQTYHLQANFVGAMVTLYLDGVAVGTAEVTSPMGRARQVGILCRGDHSITITNFTVNTSKPKAFVVMQFGAEYDDVYQDVVKEVCKDYEVNVLRADEVNGPGLIISDIVREISAAQLVIADITPTSNPNVFFEVGYALALKKPTILLARKGTPLPFDLAGFRVLFYEDTIGGKNRLEEGLRRHLDAILSV